ncbi:hypothetical protein [Streptomyces sp. NPDC054838]
MIGHHIAAEAAHRGHHGTTNSLDHDEWQQAGVFDRLHRILLSELNAAGELDWSRACVNGSSIRAKKGTPTPAPRRPTGGRQAENTI